MVDISDGIQFRRDEVDPNQWPKLSCSQANQVALEVGDLRLDANREIFLQGNGQLRSFGDMLLLTGDPSLEKLRILANGNVGIGKPDPGAKLEVNGNLLLQQGVAVNEFSSDGNLTDNSDLSVPTEKAVKTYVSAQIAVVNQALSTKAALAGASSQDFQTKNLTVSGNLTTTGNVGIGTTTTPANLEVNGTVKATAFQGNGTTLDGIVKKTGDAMTGALTINNALTVSGNVGIGTTNPEGGLDINRGTVDAQADASSDTLPFTAKADLVLTRRHSATKSLNGYPASLIDFRATNAESTPNEWSVAQILGVVDLNVLDGYAGGLAFLTSPPGSNNPDGRRTRGAAPTARMVIDANGNVGIGTTTPQGFQIVLPENNKTNSSTAGVTIAGGKNGNANIELRNNGSGTPYIDFAQSTSPDYDARIILTEPDQLEIQGAKLIANGAVITGMILMWSGKIQNIPSGWALCDGKNGTPDLRNMFIVGAGDKYSVNDKGGADRVTLSLTEMPSHQHNGSTSINGSHTHDIYRGGNRLTYVWGGQESTTTVSAGMNSDQGASFYAGSNGDHQHSFTTSSQGGNLAHENRPPYYALCLIMKL